MITTALIMAGGRGERFWPKSRKGMPKQFLSLTDDGKTMLQLTVQRILPMVKLENVYIATNKDYKSLVLEQLPNLPEENILCEPIGRNTAPCIGLGAMHIAKKHAEAMMFIFPADHLIKFENMFLQTLRDAYDVAKKADNLVTIGVAPSYPETGYGYIKFAPNIIDGRVYKVDHFVEKPSIDVAKEYLASAEYLWNSGMFIWKVSSILKNMQELMPETYEALKRIQDSIGTDQEKSVLEKEFIDLQPQSIDYGIMEKAKNIYIIPGSFGWDDVGSWLSVERIKTTNEFGNVVDGNIITVDTYNSIIQGGEKLIAMVGLENVVVVDTNDATLICSKDHVGDIKKILENLKICNRERYL